MQLNTQLCKSEGTYTHQWCYYEAFDNYSIVVQYAFLATLIVFFCFLTKSFIRLTKLRETKKFRDLFGNVYLHVYYFLYAWVILSLTKGVINFIVFQIYMRPDFTNQPEPSNIDPPIDSPIVILSSIFIVLDTMTGVCLFSLFWLISYKWIGGILLNIQERQSIDIEKRKVIHRCFKILLLVKYYNYTIRALFTLFILAEPILLYFTSIGCSLLKYNSYFFYIDGFLVFVFYIFGYFLFRFMNKCSLISLEQTDERRVKIEYFFLFSTLFFRMFLNFYFKLFGYSYTPNQNCSDPKNKIATSICLALSLFILHTLPIVTITYIYQPNVNMRMRDEKIIRNSFVYGDSLQTNFQENIESLLSSENKRLKSEEYIQKIYKLENETVSNS